MCEKVEALADAPVDDALELVEQLQAEWRTVGPAPKDAADEVWNRFRGACDQIYQRARSPEPPSSTASPNPPAPLGWSAPKLGDLIKK